MKLIEKARAGVRLLAALLLGAAVRAGVVVSHHFRVECVGPDGALKWAAEARNLVVNVGLDEILDKFYKGATYTAAHYVGLTDGTPTVAAGDTMGSHAGWSEVTAYSEANRPTLTLGAVSGQSVDNSGNQASFSVNANGTTIGGAFLATAATKGGSSGILIGAAAFGVGDKSADDGDTLNVTVTATMASA